MIALDLASWQVSRELGLFANCTLLAVVIVWVVRPYRFGRLEPPVLTVRKLERVGVLKDGKSRGNPRLAVSAQSNS